MNSFYHSSLWDFLDFATEDKNAIVESIFSSAIEHKTNIGDREKASWAANIDALRSLFSLEGEWKKQKWMQDVIIAFEVKLPIAGRIDCAIFGKDREGCNNFIHIELKQWSNGNVASFYTKDTLVITGGTDRISAHPLAQVANYQAHLVNFLPIFDDKSYKATGIAYCYNYDTTADSILTNSSLSNEFELYGNHDKQKLFETIRKLTECGGGNEVFKNITASPVRPTLKLNENAAKLFLNNNTDFKLIGKQLDAFNAILSLIEKSQNINDDTKSVFIIKGGPGTGKTVIALRLISELSKRGYENVFYTTRATALRESLQNSISNCAGYGSRDLISNIFMFRPYLYEENKVGALIVDEAHRISSTSNHFTDRSKDVQTYLSQTLALIYTSRISIFFIDNDQRVKNDEVGNSGIIRDVALNYHKKLKEAKLEFEKELKKLTLSISRLEEKLKKCQDKGNSEEINKVEEKLKNKRDQLISNRKWLCDVKSETSIKTQIFEFQLEDQFRCNGSSDYQLWVDNLLEIGGHKDENLRFNRNEYLFKIFDSPVDLYTELRSKDDYAKFADSYMKSLGSDFSYEKLKKYISLTNPTFSVKARLVAGWCWDWTGLTQENGDLINEVSIDEFDFHMPWETKRSAKGDFKFKYAKSEKTWCSDNEGINQVGCIYSIQGFETDYVGVIIGPDMVYNDKTGKLETREGITHDIRGKNTDVFIRNIYRVLMTRGTKGCYVFACDPGVRDYIKRMVGD